MPVSKVCKVCIPNTKADVYDYLYSAEPPLLGARVLVPFRHKLRVGIAWSLGESHLSLDKLKMIEASESVYMLDGHYRDFCEWLSRYYHFSLSDILALALPKLLRDFQRPIERPSVPCYTLVQEFPEKLPRSKKLASLLSFLANTSSPCFLATIKAEGFDLATLKRAISQNYIEESERPIELQTFPATQIDLNEEQQQALAQLSFQKFGVYVLDGVTGSGKTEVYIEWMRQVLTQGQQVLFLVPEIGLTAALLHRLQSRLGVAAVLMHSDLTDKQRLDNWLQAYHQAAALIVGTRSAVFANLPKLGLIIIDEEHDLSFRQMEGLRYSAKDAAIMRAKLLNVPIVLGSATPCLETLYNLSKNKYFGIKLRHKALSKTPLHYQVLDLRAQKVEHGLAANTMLLIQQHLELKHQVLVFMNRRGYAHLLYCHQCGWTKRCHHCDANMTWHRGRQRLSCHHCGAESKLPAQCQNCGAQSLLTLGVGTERLYEFLVQAFPQYRCLRFDRDVVKNRSQLELALDKIHQHQVDLIIGTQMLTKGHHFPKLSLVVVVDADAAFFQADFRALERLGQLLTQVAGRAGRAEVPGEVLIQTHLPHHPSLKILLQQGYTAFSEVLLADRKLAGFPPYMYLGLLRVQGRNSSAIEIYLRQLRQKITINDCVILGPAPAPMEKKAGIFRWQLLLKASTRPCLHRGIDVMQALISAHPPLGMRCFIELDPYEF